MIPKEELRRILNYIKNKNYTTTAQYNPYDLVQESIKYIGDPDPTLRDDLVLSFLEAMILNQVLNDSQVISIKNICLSNLSFGLGKIDDTIFTRTFSMLVIAIILYRHRNYPFLNKGDIITIFEKMIYTYNNDQDVRGYVETKGWAHGAAHGADVFLELSQMEEINGNDMQRILDAICNKVKIGHYGYIHNEDDRMARVVVSIINRKVLSNQFLYEWIKKFELPAATGVTYIVRRNNIRNFLRCLYFYLYEKQPSLSNVILDVINANFQ